MMADFARHTEGQLWPYHAGLSYFSPTRRKQQSAEDKDAATRARGRADRRTQPAPGLHAKHSIQECSWAHRARPSSRVLERRAREAAPACPVSRSGHFPTTRCRQRAGEAAELDDLARRGPRATVFPVADDISAIRTGMSSSAHAERHRRCFRPAKKAKCVRLMIAMRRAMRINT